MNTPASAVTVFVDDSTGCEGPDLSGPNLYEWARLVAEDQVPVADSIVHLQARALRPWAQSTRAFYGHYLNWAFKRIADISEERVKVNLIRSRAVALEDAPDGRQLLWLQDISTPIHADAVVLTQGHFDVAPTAEEQRLADFADAHGLCYLPPANAADVDTAVVPAGASVIIRGLGLCFFDYVALLTADRGGRFVRERRGLTYRPSGHEPIIYAGSGRGVPHLARADDRSPSTTTFRPRFFNAAAVNRLRERAGEGTNDFLRDVWPLVAKEVCWSYYSHLLAHSTALTDGDWFAAEYAAAQWDSERMRRLISTAFPDPSTRWDWERERQPSQGIDFADRQAYHAWVLARLRQDVAESAPGTVHSARRAATATLRSLREQVRQAISHRGISGTSYRQHVDGWFSGLTNSLVAGPPAFRVEQLAALAEADVVRFIGARMRVAADEANGAFVVRSAQPKGDPLCARTLIDARLPVTDIRRSADPLISMLLYTGGCRPHVIPNADGSEYVTGGLDVAEHEFRVIQADGAPHPRRFAFGPPVKWAQGAFGSTIQVGLRQADVIARQALETAKVLRSTTGSQPPASDHPHTTS